MSLSEIIEVEKELNQGADDFVAFQTAFPEHHLIEENARLVASLAGLRNEQNEIRRQTEELVIQARKDRDRIINEQEELAKEAETRGFAKGLEDGRQSGRQELADQLTEIAGLFAEIDRQRATLSFQYEEELLRLVQVMVERLVNRELTGTSQGIERCITEALEYVIENTEVRVRLHEDDRAFLKSGAKGMLGVGEGTSRIELVSDKNISRGGCLLETDFGEVDATMETCRARLFKIVDDSFRAGGK